jgi:hypothetical protein
VTVFDGNTLQSRKRFYGRSTNAHAGTAVAAGDVDNDGVADIIVGAPDENGVGSVRAYNSSGTELLQKLGSNKKTQFGKARGERGHQSRWICRYCDRRTAGR